MVGLIRDYDLKPHKIVLGLGFFTFMTNFGGDSIFYKELGSIVRRLANASS